MAPATDEADADHRRETNALGARGCGTGRAPRTVASIRLSRGDHMANDREQRDQQDKSSDELGKNKPGSSGKREIGEGMHSLDSTQVPLKSETGEPDWDAVNGRVDADGKDRDTNR